MTPKMKKRISIDVDVELTSSDLLGLLETSDPFTQCVAVRRVTKALSDYEIQLLIRTFPEGARLFLDNLQEFVARMDKIRAEVEADESVA